MKIGILTGGGDVPGLNPCIKALVNRAIDADCEVTGIRQGWAGLLNYNPEDEASSSKWIMPLNKTMVRTIDRSGGTFLHTSYLKPSSVTPKEVPLFLREADWSLDADTVQDFTPHILKNLEQLEIDVLIAIGGVGTLDYGHRLNSQGVPIIAIPKTMDNDVYGTDYCIGFSTAISRSVNFIHTLRTSIGSHEHIGVIELFGRHSGETALISAYLADVDRAIISEVPFEPEKLAVFLAEDKQNNPSNYAILTISEGASMLGGREYTQTNGTRRVDSIGAITGEALTRITGENIIYQQVAHLMRSGVPDAIDLMVSFNFANMALDLIAQQKTGQLVAVREGKYTTLPIENVTYGVKRVDVDELYDVEAYRPKVRHVNQKPMFLY